MGSAAPLRVRVLAGVAAALALLGCSQQTAVPSTDTASFNHLGVADAMRSYHPPSQVGLPVSVVQFATGSYLVCDFANVYRVSRTSTGYSVTTLRAPDVPVWTPAGLDYRNGTLYVADYRGHDVLVLRLEGDALTLVRRITNPQLNEPKHLKAAADGSVVVADHNGDAVLRFDPDGTLQWRVRVDQANGITQSGGVTYATSLLSKTITKIDGSGHIVDVKGGPGMAVGRYLLPVDLADLGDRIALTDAVNGRITMLDHDLKVVGHTGGNGPGLDAFNYPFSLLPVQDGFVVADAFKQRLVRVDRSWTIREQVALGPWVPVGRGRPLVYGSAARPTTYETLPGVDIAAELGLRSPLSFAGAYGGLDHVGPGGAITHLDLTDPDLGDTAAFWAEKVDRYVVVGSAESHLMLVVDPATAMFTYVEVGEDNWWSASTLLTSVNLRRQLGDVIRPAVETFDRARQLIDGGRTRAEVFATVLAGGQTREVAADLATPQAQQFLQSPMTAADAGRYFTWAMGQSEQHVIELLVIKYLSGT